MLITSEKKGNNNNQQNGGINTFSETLDSGCHISREFNVPFVKRHSSVSRLVLSPCYYWSFNLYNNNNNNNNNI